MSAVQIQDKALVARPAGIVAQASNLQRVYRKLGIVRREQLAGLI